ncbi:hypothetical protein EJ082_13560 [Brevundimonas diminuta]|uniref:Uncharacterized protein n=1 Tax=Brevundimonas diminuta TaxID=293 RepID=A0A410NWE9_BREDI|nr:hypothetical protein [Brevundimonas diminuta]MBD3573993.1 hypothetical protein [Brevundimonas diminuta]MBD3817603.1 hypothetical protein [Brevundimonas diminuta]QAT14218.1 hypothetical protein EQG53_07490 [Brevundimonas diminuta]QQB88408.1 hypothetical protein I6H83_14940 [Brevundimonas diminuta]GEB99813.1 hypothetical protein BDI01nite_08780 [Brevundimonas diminuta]
MAKFKTLMIPVLAATTAAVAIGAALPAAAQSYRHAPVYESRHDGWRSIHQRKYNLDRRIDQGVRTRQLSVREASRLKNELNSLVRLERAYQRDGLSRRERMELDRRYDALSAKVRYERRDHNGRRW